MSKLVQVTIAAVTMLALTASASAKIIAGAVSSGVHATTVATGRTTNRKKLSVHVTATPAQRVTVSWDTVCSHGFTPRTVAGQFVARAPVTRAIRSPTLAGTYSCIVSAQVALSSKGSLVVEIFAA
jgi:hypothetical protein